MGNISVDMEHVESMASSIENLIADYLPEADKELPRTIARAVVKELLENFSMTTAFAGSNDEIQQKLSAVLDRMSMAEYQRMRKELLDKMSVR